MKITDSLKQYRQLKRRLVTDGIVAGIFAGLLSVGYRWILSVADLIRHDMLMRRDPTSLLLWVGACVVFALVIGRLLEWEPLSSGSGIPQVQGEILGYFNMSPLRLITAKVLGGFLGSLAGLSLGREGPSIQIGAAAGKLSSRLLHRDLTEESYIVSAGASAGLAAAFNAPLAGTLFTLEEMHKNFSPLILIPSLIAAVIADFLCKNVFGLAPVFRFTTSQALPLTQYYAVLFMGIITGFVGVLFNKSIPLFQDAFKKLPTATRYWPLLAAVPVVLLGFWLPGLTGGGHHLIEEVAHHPTALWMLFVLLFLKLILTSLSYGSKAQGGIFLPVLVLGGLSGILWHQFLQMGGMMPGLYRTNFVILGMAGILTAVVRSPILSIILVTEMTGSFSHLLALSAVAITAYLTAELLGSKPIYETLMERMLGHGGKQTATTKRVVKTFRLPMDSAMAGHRVKELSLPKHVLLVGIDRGDEEIIPKGDTKLLAGDEITLVVESRDISLVLDYMDPIEEGALEALDRGQKAKP
ncbi:Cl- channel, voltage-gated family protein [Clostridiaceae bacterium JG1575]|nr:Cl- channel, voltage-gated family protein [Clostridiaceae bacterium JG1575]